MARLVVTIQRDDRKTAMLMSAVTWDQRLAERWLWFNHWVVALAVVYVLVCSSVSVAGAKEPANRVPNFVVILMDDMGWRDVGFMGNEFVETPHLDSLARRGVVFSQAYASAPNCAPTRACLLSGQYTPRHGIYTVVDPRQPVGSPWHKLMAAESKSELATDVVTLAEALKTGGYDTGFFGMWNLGRGRSGPVTPGGQGFRRVVFPDTIGFGKDAYFDKQGRYLSDRLTDEVLSFIEQNRERPFFVYLADHAVHAPWEPKAGLREKYVKKRAAMERPGRGDDPDYAATIAAVDENVGRIVEALQRWKLTDNTMVIFTSDNGGTSQFTAPLNGGKGQLYEGGIRVPLVMTGPGVKHAGSTCQVPVSSVDLYPTLLEMARLTAPHGQVLDGVSLVPALQGEGELRRERLFWHFPCYVGKAPPSSAMREGKWKLVEFFEDGGHVELYNLEADPNERKDLAKSLPERAEAMHRVLRAWQQQTGAAVPRTPNPDYDPKSSRPRGRNPKTLN